MWDVQPIAPSGDSFFVNDGSAALARWVVDPDIPWVLIEEHSVYDNTPAMAFLRTSVPLSAQSPARSVRAILTMDLLFRTEEFLEALGELEHGGGGMVLWQLDKEPSSPPWLGRQMFGPQKSEKRWYHVRRGLGVRLMMLCPHECEVTQIAGPEPSDVQRAWERVRTAREK